MEAHHVTGDEERGMPDVPERPAPAGKGNWLVRNARFIIRNRMYSFNYWRSLYRFIKFKVRHPGIKTEGYVFLPRHYEISKGKGASLTIGGFTWIGEGCAFRAHEGSLRIGQKCTFGGKNTINCYNHVEIGDENLWADNIYVVDFDHWFLDPHMSVRSQGIRPEHVIIQNNVWIGEKATILRGVTIRAGQRDRGDVPCLAQRAALLGDRRDSGPCYQVPEEPSRRSVGRRKVRDVRPGEHL